MDERERARYEVRNGKHPSACTCVVCDEKRRLGPEGLRLRRAEAEKIRRASAEGDYHGVLGVKPGTSPEATRSRFRDLAKRWHPDVYHQDAGETMRLINAAYDVLSDPARRDAHERTREEERGKQRRYEEWQRSQRQQTAWEPPEQAPSEQAQWSWSQWHREAQEQAEREREKAWQAWREEAARKRQEQEQRAAEERRRREQRQHAAWVKRQERRRRREEHRMRLSALTHQAVRTAPQALPAFAVGYAVGLLFVFRALPDALQRLLRLDGILP